MAQRLVVVGGGAAGMSAASAARRQDPDLEIVVLEATGFAAYGMCGLPYYLAGIVETSDALLAYPPEYFVNRRHLDLRLHARVESVDAGRQTVTWRRDGRLVRERWDALVVTTGGAPVVPRVPGLAGDRVFTIRTLEDAIRLRSLLDAGWVARAVVVGGGYIGLEMAEALVARGCEVVVAEALPRVLANVDPPVAALAEDELRRHGVELRTGAALTEVRATGDALVAVIGGEPVPCDVVVVATGVRPGAGVLAAAGAATGPSGALLVDARMRTSLPAVHAAGDCAVVPHLVLGAPAYVPLGPAANRAGRVAGTVAAGGDAAFGGVVGTAVVKVFDLTVARTGLTLEEAERAGLPATATDVVHRSRAKYYPGSEPLSVRLVTTPGGRLLGAQLAGREGVAKRVDVLATALHAGMDVCDVAALDLAYAPPYAPVHDPIIVAAETAVRALRAAPVPL